MNNAQVHDSNDRILPASFFVVAMGILERYLRDNNTLYIDVRKVISHKNYRPLTFEHDIALTILSTSVPANHPNVQPINLATISPPVGQTCLISGWGTMYYDGPQPSRLQAANVNVNSRSDCNRPISHNGKVLNGMFCAGSFFGNNISDSW